MDPMFPIALINGHHLMQRSLIGANACDPVVPERPKRPGRAKRQGPATRRVLVVKPRGTS